MNEITTTQNAMQEQPVKSGNVILNTVDTSNIEGSKLVINSINSANSLSRLTEDDVLCVKDCIIMAGVRKGRGNREDETCANIYLIDTDGQAWFSQSEGVFRSVGLIYSMFNDFGKSTPDGYLKIKVVSNQLANGNTTKTLVVL